MSKPQDQRIIRWDVTEVIAGDVHRALAVLCDAYPDAVVHVIRKSSRFRTLLVDRGDVPDA